MCIKLITAIAIACGVSACNGWAHGHVRWHGEGMWPVQQQCKNERRKKTVLVLSFSSNLLFTNGSYMG
jgi:hypothetical protein